MPCDINKLEKDFYANLTERLDYLDVGGSWKTFRNQVYCIDVDVLVRKHKDWFDYYEDVVSQLFERKRALYVSTLQNKPSP